MDILYRLESDGGGFAPPAPVTMPGDTLTVIDLTRPAPRQKRAPRRETRATSFAPPLPPFPRPAPPVGPTVGAVEWSQVDPAKGLAVLAIVGLLGAAVMFASES